MDNDLVKKLYEEIKKRKLDEQEDDIEMDDDNSTEDSQGEEMNVESDETSDEFCEMISKLLHSKTQTHIFHLSVKGSGSYATHKALQNYYEAIDGVVDGLVESYQGKYGLITDYTTSDLKSYTSVNDVINYFEDLNDMVESNRSCCDDSFIQNQIDTVQELIFSTVYKLKFLK